MLVHTVYLVGDILVASWAFVGLHSPPKNAHTKHHESRSRIVFVFSAFLNDWGGCSFDGFRGMQDKLERVDSSQWRALLYSLCFMHSVVQVRANMVLTGLRVRKVNRADIQETTV